MTVMTPEESGFSPTLYAGRRVVVVGGTSGIGRGIADAFAAHGATVSATGATAAVVAAAGAGSFAALDVRDDAAVRAYFEALDRLDVLVNCAGILRRGDEHRPEVGHLRRGRHPPLGPSRSRACGRRFGSPSDRRGGGRRPGPRPCAARSWRRAGRCQARRGRAG